MKRGSPPLPPRKPPRLPRRPAPELGVAVGKASPQSCSGEDNRIPPRFATPCDDDREEEEQEDNSCLDLAKLMLSEEGMALKKITLEGFTIPVVLRLLDRGRFQQQQQHQRRSISEASAAAAALSITWVDQDAFGFDMRGLTVRRADEGCVDGGRPGRAAAAGRKRSRGVDGGSGSGGGDCYLGPGTEEAHVLLLSWSMGGGSAEVVLEAASRQQRDLLLVTLETLVSGLHGGDNSAADRLSGAGGAGGCNGVEDGDDDGSGTAAAGLPLDRAASRSSAVHEPPLSAADIYGSDGDDDDAVAAETPVAAELRLSKWDEAAAAAPEADAAADTAARRTTLAPHETDVTPAAALGGGGGLLFSSADGTAFGRAATVTHPQACRKAGRRRGVSFGPGASAGAPAGAPALARARTTGTAMLGREGEAALQQQEEEQQARLRRQEAMMRLLAVYDRARDESQAAAWRLGVRKPCNVDGGLALFWAWS